MRIRAWKSHRINLIDHCLHYDVPVFDVNDGCHSFSLGPHENGSKDHAQITCLHQVLIRVCGNTAKGMRARDITRWIMYIISYEVPFVSKFTSAGHLFFIGDI